MVNCLLCRRPGFNPLVGKVPWRRAWQPTPVFLPGESPWTGEPGGLQYMRLQRVGHDGIYTESYCILSTLATWCEELTHWKRFWCWERLRGGGEGSGRVWHGWIASLTQWTWVWAKSGRGWRTGKPGMLLEPHGAHGVTNSQTQLSDWTTITYNTSWIKQKMRSEDIVDIEWQIIC